MRDAVSPSMSLALAVWLCTLPFVFLLVVPWLGARAAVVTALALLAGITLVCWVLCACDRAGRSLPTPSGDGTEPSDVQARAVHGARR